VTRTTVARDPRFSELTFTQPAEVVARWSTTTPSGYRASGVALAMAGKAAVGQRLSLRVGRAARPAEAEIKRGGSSVHGGA